MYTSRFEGIYMELVHLCEYLQDGNAAPDEYLLLVLRTQVHLQQQLGNNEVKKKME